MAVTGKSTTSDPSIYRTANLLIRKYGEMAPVGAIIKADPLMEAGDLAGQTLWMKVAKAAEELLSDERPGDATVH
jgi:hypothetical protein